MTSMLDLDISLLRLLEVDNIPDGIEILQERVSNETNSINRQEILRPA